MEDIIFCVINGMIPIYDDDTKKQSILIKNITVNQITVHLVYIKEDVISSLTQGHTHTVGAIERAIAKQPDITR